MTKRDQRRAFLTDLSNAGLSFQAEPLPLTEQHMTPAEAALEADTQRWLSEAFARQQAA